MNKKFRNKYFSNIETRRSITLSRNSSAAEAEKFERQVSAKASLRSADLREYYFTISFNLTYYTLFHYTLFHSI